MRSAPAAITVALTLNLEAFVFVVSSARPRKRHFFLICRKAGKHVCKPNNVYLMTPPPPSASLNVGDQILREPPNRTAGRCSVRPTRATIAPQNIGWPEPWRTLWRTTLYRILYRMMMMWATGPLTKEG